MQKPGLETRTTHYEHLTCSTIKAVNFDLPRKNILVVFRIQPKRGPKYPTKSFVFSFRQSVT